jgi:hypothetical protein
VIAVLPTWIKIVLGFVIVTTAPQIGELSTGEGQAAIRDGQVATARELAIKQAQWDAVASKLGVVLKAETLNVNFRLAEDVILTRVQGAVRSSRVIAEERRGPLYWVRVEAVIDRQAAEEKAAELIRNTSVVVMLPATFEGKTLTQNVLSELLIQRLIDGKYTVIDETAAGQHLEAAEFQSLMTGSPLALRSVALKFLSNMAVTGKIDGTVTIKPGDDIPFVGKATDYGVRATVNYRVLSLAPSGAQSGKLIASGSVSAMGLGTSSGAAFENAVRALGNPASQDIFTKYEKFFDETRQSITIRVVGNIDVPTHARIKETLGQVPWLTSMTDQGLGQFLVDYREKPVYLVYSLDNNPRFSVQSFTPTLIELRLK